MSRVHEPECNVYCDQRGHYLLPSGPFGEPFSHQERADRRDDDPVSGVAGNPEGSTEK